MLAFACYLGKMIGVGVAQAVILLCIEVVLRITAIPVSGFLGFLLFYVPTTLAFGGYCYFTWFQLPSTCGLVAKLVLTSLASLLAVAISTTCFLTVFFNIWGS